MSELIRQSNDTILIAVKVQPKSSRDELIGVHGNELKIKLTAPPIDGKANKGLINFLAKILKIPKSSISIVRGETSKNKTVAIENLSVEEVKSRLALPTSGE